MDNLIKKVIRASAGTGKTFRLSLEYIGLLLTYQKLGIHYSEILVITFTKKATAEIRERIFQHLHDLSNQTAQGKELEKIIKDLFGLTIEPNHVDYLKRVYHDMLTNKTQVQISTIDSFTKTIFQTIIAPFLGITQFGIENSLDEEQKSDIYQTILKDKKNLVALKDFFLQSGRKTINDYEKFLESIIYQRWLFHHILQMTKANPVEDKSEFYLEQYKTELKKLLDDFKNVVNTNYNDKPVDKVLKKEFFMLLYGVGSDPKLSQVSDDLYGKAADVEFIRSNYKALLKADSFWNGSTLFRKKAEKELGTDFKAHYQLVKEHLANFMLHSDYAREQEHILHVADIILQKYHDIRFRDKVFSHSDIAYYTYYYLYDPELSLIDNDAVTNAFYEYLTSRIRFVLIDEFQDTSILQHKMLLPIIREITSGSGVKEYGGVIVVGDEKQAIYGWRGGERDLLLNMPDILGHGVQNETLTTSYRSPQNVIGFINNVFAEPDFHHALSEQGIDWVYDSITAFNTKSQGFINAIVRNFYKDKNGDNEVTSKDEAVREFVEKQLVPLLQSGQIKAAETVVLARQNNELQSIAALLDEHNIPYMLESSNSIFAHRAIKPLFYILNFLVYHDPYDLLKFLRSDYVLLNSPDLKTTLQELAAGMNPLDINHKAIQRVVKVVEYSHKQFSGLPLFFQHIFEQFGVMEIFPLENDMKNMNHFLEMTANFELNDKDFSNTLPGFLNYCEKNDAKESFQQIGLKELDAVNLMTIHKSKGLEYDNVFIYWNLSKRSETGAGKMHEYYQFEPDFQRLKDFTLTFNFNDVLEHCEKKEQKIVKERRGKVEELNTLYVAMTRAKRNLWMYFGFSSAKGHGTFFEENRENMDALVAHAVMTQLESVDSSPWMYEYATGQLEATTQSESASSDNPNFSYIRKYINLDRSQKLAKDEAKLEREKHLDFKSIYLNKKAADIGNVAHFYLSFIKHNRDDERDFARLKTISYYGNLLKVEQIHNIIDQVNEFMNQQSDIFSPETWPDIFNEFTLFSTTGQEIRPDRLMINRDKKIVKIIDFKTGDHYDQKQIDEYKEAILQLPFVKNENFEVLGDFIEIELESWEGK